MKIQRKLLTNEQRKAICDSYDDKGCGYCPLRLEFENGEGWASCCWIKQTEKEIQNYWNEEIEVDYGN